MTNWDAERVATSNLWHPFAIKNNSQRSLARNIVDFPLRCSVWLCVRMSKLATTEVFIQGCLIVHDTSQYSIVCFLWAQEYIVVLWVAVSFSVSWNILVHCANRCVSLRVRRSMYIRLCNAVYHPWWWWRGGGGGWYWSISLRLN